MTNSIGSTDVVFSRNHPRHSPICESLEARTLLATVLYQVPGGNSIAYIQPKSGGDPGQLQIRLGSPTATPVTPNPFENATGQSIVDAGTNSNFTFVDQVPGALKPFSDGTHEGLMVQSTPGNATLRVEATGGDRLITVGETGSNVTYVRLTDYPSFDDGDTQLGTGVPNLVIKPQPVTSPTGHWPPSGSNLDRRWHDDPDFWCWRG